MTKQPVKRLVYAALFLALCMVLPFLTGQIPEIGSMLLPMHIPVLLCGFFCGWSYGAIVGFIAPLLRSLIFGMPPILTAIPMAFELLVYGLLAGLMYRVLPKKAVFTYAALLIAMIGGRLVWGAASWALYGLRGQAFGWEVFIGGSVLNALPGIILQIVLIPAIVLSIRDATRTKERALLFDHTKEQS